MTFAPTELVAHWGYGAIVLAVLLGNVGVPIPEETVLALGGYLAQRGHLRLSVVIVIGFVSAVLGDNLGYWLGRRYGGVAIERFGHLVFMTPARLAKMSGLVTRYGAWTVFAARFVPGLRVLAGPLAGATGLGPLTFVTANSLGAVIYIPLAVGMGYAVGYGVGDHIERLIGRAERIVLVAVVAVTLGVLALRIVRARYPTR
jgi:membrane protein DedA with SNARE-associated domain